MVLTVKPQEIEFVYDELDTNAINFRMMNGYLSIQTGVYLEDDEALNEPFIEFNDQRNAQSGGMACVIFHRDKLSIDYAEPTPFLGKYAVVEIWPNGGVTRQIVDFFNNHLFLGEIAKYSDDFDAANIVPPAAKRDFL